MRKFNQSQDQSIKPKSGVRSSYGANNIPRYQALSPMVSIGTINPKPTEQIFHVASPMEDSLERPRQLASLQCKEVIDLVRPELALGGIRSRGRFNCRPDIGGMRGDAKGLASDPVYPTNTPLLQKTDSFFAYLPSPMRK